MGTEDSGRGSRAGLGQDSTRNRQVNPGRRQSWHRMGQGVRRRTPRTAHRGKCLVACDVEIEAIAAAVEGIKGPVTIITDSLTAVQWLTTQEDGEVRRN